MLNLIKVEIKNEDLEVATTYDGFIVRTTDRVNFIGTYVYSTVTLKEFKTFAFKYGYITKQEFDQGFERDFLKRARHITVIKGLAKAVIETKIINQLKGS